MLTTLTPYLSLYLIHAHAKAPSGLHVSGSLKVNVYLDWNVGRLVLVFPKVVHFNHPSASPQCPWLYKT